MFDVFHVIVICERGLDVRTRCSSGVSFDGSSFSVECVVGGTGEFLASSWDIFCGQSADEGSEGWLLLVSKTLLCGA